MHIACTNGNIDIVRLLLGHRECDINAEYTSRLVSQTALHISCLIGNVDIVQLLLNANIDVNAKYKKTEYRFISDIKITQSSIHIACKNENIAIVRLLSAKEGIDINSLYEERRFFMTRKIKSKIYSIYLKYLPNCFAHSLY